MTFEMEEEERGGGGGGREKFWQIHKAVWFHVDTLQLRDLPSDLIYSLLLSFVCTESKEAASQAADKEGLASDIIFFMTDTEKKTHKFDFLTLCSSLKHQFRMKKFHFMAVVILAYFEPKFDFSTPKKIMFF